MNLIVNSITRGENQGAYKIALDLKDTLDNILTSESFIVNTNDANWKTIALIKIQSWVDEYKLKSAELDTLKGNAQTYLNSKVVL